MTDDENMVRADAGSYSLAYGQGGRVFRGQLPDEAIPLITRDEDIYGIEVRRRKGKLVVLGDAGMVSNGLVCFPGYDNANFQLDLFNRLKPGWRSTGIKSWDYFRYAPAT